MSRLRRGLKTLGKIAIGMVLVLVVVDLALTLVLSRRVASEIARLKASGEPTTITEIAPKKVPGSENAAVIYAKAYKELKQSLSDADNEARWSILSPVERVSDPALWDKARRVLARTQYPIMLVEQALSRPKCVFPVEWEKGGAVQLHHLSELHSLAGLLSANALVNAHDGRPAEAVRSLAIGLRSSNSLAEEPLFVSQMERQSLIHTYMRSFREVVRFTRIDGTQARRLYDALRSIDLNEGYARAMRTQPAFGLWYFDEFREDPGMIAECVPCWMCLCDDVTGLNPELLYPLVIRLHSRTPISYADELLYLKRIEDRVKNASLPYRLLKRQRPDLLRKQRFPLYAIGSYVLLHADSSFVAERDDTIAIINGGQVLCALLAYKDRFGGYPRSLGELRSKLGWKLPEDPYSGKSFVYRRQGKGCTFYSIGENLKDDGGISYDRPPEKTPVKPTIETPPPGYDPTTEGTPPGSSGVSSDIPTEVPPPVPSPTDEVVSPSAPPPHIRPPKPPFSTLNMRYNTVDGRNSEDIIWRLER